MVLDINGKGALRQREKNPDVAWDLNKHHPTDRIVHTTAFDTPVVENWLKQKIYLMGRR